MWRAAYIDRKGQPHGPRLAATIHHPEGVRWDEDIIARRAHLLSRLYGNCIMTLEVNQAGGVFRWLLDHGANLWKRTKADEASGIVGATINIPGWKTSEFTRDIIISAMAKFIREQEGTVEYAKMVHQLKMFITYANGKAMAAPGEHDDWVMGPGIGLALLDSATTYEPPAPVTPKTVRERGPDTMGKGQGAFG